MKYWKISNWLFSFGTCEYVKGEDKIEAVKQWSYYTRFNNLDWGEFQIEFSTPRSFRLKPTKMKCMPPIVSVADIDEVSEAEYVEEVLL